MTLTSTVPVLIGACAASTHPLGDVEHIGTPGCRCACHVISAPGDWLNLPVWLDEFQGHVDRLWPGETIRDRAMCLAEEAGEVCRAVTKRRHAEDDGTCKGQTREEWTENLRIEVGQAIGVALSICCLEGFDPAQTLVDVLDDLAARPTVLRDSTLNSTNSRTIPATSAEAVRLHHTEHHGGAIEACQAVECMAAVMLS